MKLVTAIVQPGALEAVQLALVKIGVHGMTVTEVSGHARQRGHTEVYRGTEFTIDFIAKVKLEVLIKDSEISAVLDAITQAARSGKVGDGKVWIVPVEDVVRIRTGETGDEAI